MGTRGTSVKILRWYEPNQQVLEALGAQGQNWNMRTLIDQQQIIDAMLQKKEWLFNGIRWNQFHSPSDRPDVHSDQSQGRGELH
jgi:hypothetical protein